MHKSARKKRSSLALVFLGVVLLAALAGAVVRSGDIERFLQLSLHVEPWWLFAALALQSGTYLCEARAWRSALRKYGQRLPMTQLIPLSVAKLFSDQAVPSAGISGSAFFVTALRRRGIAAAPAITCMLIDLAAYFFAYASMTLASLLVLIWHEELSRWLLLLTAGFLLVQASTLVALRYLLRHGVLPGASALSRSPRLRAWTRSLQQRTPMPDRQGGLFLELTGLHAAIMLLDAASLWAMLLGIGQDARFALVFSSFVTASMVMSLSPIPLGLGSFEATCVAMLHAAGIGLEAALTSTVLLRGITTWLPMLPGLWLVRREMRQASLQ